MRARMCWSVFFLFWFCVLSVFCFVVFVCLFVCLFVGLFACLLAA